MRYPDTPANVNINITEPSEAFKRNVLNVLGSIIIFILVYFVLMLSAIGLAILCGFGGIGLIAFKPSLITIMLGLGLIGLGVMVLIFLIKFLFNRVKVDRSHLVEVKQSEQPELFSFIEKITAEVKAPFPKHIYLSADVNASVFYDSGFWSMFLPIRKNLQIGLGLINATTLSELKAVLAHEFGHFSQRSMKLGSYVYNVNKVIFNMLYDNSGYSQAIEKWGNLSGYFAIFANMTIGIVQGIQWLLQQMYEFINKQYMSLSRQMEFHADAVAASVAGGNQLASALLKLDLANITHQQLMQTYSGWTAINLKPQNIYPHHRNVMHHFANDFKIPEVDGLPVVDKDTYRRMATSRVTIDDQWASHPSTEDRVEHLEKLNINTATVSESAWLVLREPEEVQQEMTNWLYKEVSFKQTPILVDEMGFKARYDEAVNRYKLPELYQGYYDGRAITEINIETVVRDAGKLSEILTPEVLQLPRKVESLKNDLESLKMVQQRRNGIKTFEFGGQRYQRQDAPMIMTQLDEEIAQAEGLISFSDARIVALGIYFAKTNGVEESLKEKYHSCLEQEKKAVEIGKYYTTSMNQLMPIYHDEITLNQAAELNDSIRFNERKAKQLMEALQTNSTTTEEEKEVLATYISSNFKYYSAETGFNGEALELYTHAMNILYQVFARGAAESKKEYLEMQALLLQQ